MASNFNEPKSVSKYLDFAGLTAFWGKVKGYVDAQDAAVKTILTNDLAAKDAALRAYVETLKVNGVAVVSAEDKLSVSIDGTNVAVGGSNATYASSTVAAAIDGLDTRLATAEGTLADGVVTGLTTSATHGDNVWVAVGELSDAKGAVTVSVDDTAINTKFAGVDEAISDINDKIAEVEKTAGVTSFKAASEGYISVSVAGDGEGDAKKGDIVLTLDDAALDAKFEAVDAYDAANEVNLKALAGATVNGKALYTVTDGDQVSVAGNTVVLATTDINRTSGANLETALAGYDEKIAEYDEKIAALTSATHFHGVMDEIPATAYEGLEAGDIIIVGSKEYIYNAEPTAEGWAYSKDQWVELGDTTAEAARISDLEGRADAIEAWIDNNIISAGEIDTLDWTPAITAPQA